MTKAELVEDVARAAELTKKDAERLVENSVSVSGVKSQASKAQLQVPVSGFTFNSAKVDPTPETGYPILTPGTFNLKLGM
jgi:nucleoid DNA-binding protein